MKEIFNVSLGITPTTWGSEKDATRREEIRREIKKKIPEFSENYIANILNSCKEIEIIIDCYLTSPDVVTKDIDNLAKIPMDAVLFSAKGEIGYKNWEAKVTSLIVRKIKSSIPKLNIALRYK